MSLYHVPTSTERDPRPGERRTDTGEWVTPPNGEWSDADLAACGFVTVATVPQPTDTDTHTFARSVELVDGVPTEVWSPVEIPTPTASVADLLAEAEAATTVAKLRAVVVKALESGVL